MSSRSVGRPRWAAIFDSESSTPSRLVVPPSVSTAADPQGGPPRISSSERGPGRGSIGERSQATPPRVQSVPRSSSSELIPRAPTTSPPPPMPISRARSASLSAWSAATLGGDELALADLADRLRGPLELLVRHHRGALEGKIAVDLHP